jgi:tetratricopeptide (TPR) repeat protein
MRSSAAQAILAAICVTALGRAQPAQPPSAPAAPVAAPPTPSLPSSTPPISHDPSRAEGVRAYHDALARRRLGAQDALNLDEVKARLAVAEQMRQDGRVDEAIAKLTELVEHPRFDAFADYEDARAAVYVLGDALAAAGAFEPARAYLGKSIVAKGAWQGNATYARRAVRRLVEIAQETQAYAAGIEDLRDVPPTAPDEMKGEVLYLTGRAREAAGDPDGALAAYAQVARTSRWWSQATYLQGLVLVERGKLKEGEALFCKVADPKRQDKSAPVFADERFFGIRDLARLALGRLAHEQERFDDARYYYYLVPRDSDHLAEALYEAATTRYEKKDYDGARELLDDLMKLKIHHRYEDEAQILDAYIDLARCRFPEADKKLIAFVERYEPVRDATRRVSESDRSMEALLAAARTGSDAGGAEVGGATIKPEAMRAVAALVRLDPAYGAIVRKRAALEREASGLRLALGQIDDMQRALATGGGVRPTVTEQGDPLERSREARAALDAAKQQLADVEASHAPPDRIAPLRQEITTLEAQVVEAERSSTAREQQVAASGTDLPDLLRADAARASQLSQQADVARREIAAHEAALAKDTLRRLDLRLSRLLRRARLGRIESVLGRKRALEVEIEAINNGYLPQSAVDSLNAAIYLQDNEEYWPFEGDDWPDEFVGGEGLR